MFNEKSEIKLKALLRKFKKTADSYKIVWKDSFLSWEVPKNLKADFSLSIALPIAAKLKSQAFLVACEIEKENQFPFVETSVSPNGYINFHLSQNFYKECLKTEKKTKNKELTGEINIEFVSANPTGPLHLAHFRQAVVGQVLANVFRYLGHSVIKEYYINDRGKQIEDLVNSIYYFYCLFQGKKLEEGNLIYDNYLIRNIANQFVIFYGSDHLEVLDRKTRLEWEKQSVETIMEEIKKDLSRIGTDFDVWFSERSLYEKMIAENLISKLKESCLIYEENRAWYFKSKNRGDDKDRVIIKSNGEYTYFFSDILYHLNKASRCSKLINIWGADHHGYINRMISSLESLAISKSRIEILIVQVMKLVDESGVISKFSKRLGNTVTLSEALEIFDIEQLKFFLLEKEINQHLLIDVEKLKKGKDNSRLYYIQYAIVRCWSILEKTKSIFLFNDSFDLLTNELEKKILNFLIKFPLVVEQVAEEKKIHLLIHYLNNLSQIWQSFYQNFLIVDLENKKKTEQRLFLVKKIHETLKTGLNLIGIKEAVKM